MLATGIQALEAAPSLIGESPVWDDDAAALYWCDIPAGRLNRYLPASGALQHWLFDSDLSCCALIEGGGLLLALRNGVWRFDPATGERKRLVQPPYDPAHERFNDGKTDPSGRFWVGTLYEPRDPALAALYRLDGDRLQRVLGDITNCNGIAWSPDGRTQYCADTKAHAIYAFDVEPATGSLGARRVFARFPQKAEALDAYQGRPDGAAVDVEGCYWVAMYEGQRLLRLSPSGEVLRDVRLPVRCPTMPCFGGDDLKTLFITSARAARPDDELAAQPLAGRVLRMRVDVAGLPANRAKLDRPAAP
jgi:sugar lactone lactonase YvrE